MQTDVMKNQLALSKKMFPGSLSFLIKNGIDPLSLNESSLQKAIELCEEYRKNFFKAPRGAKAWENASKLEATIIDMRNNDLADSFHMQQCILCNAHNSELVQFKPESEMSEGEKMLFEIYKSMNDKPRAQVELHIQKENGAYYFICSACK